MSNINNPELLSLLPDAKLDHIGIAHKNIASLSLTLCQLLPLSSSTLREVTEHQVRVIFLHHNNHLITELELIEPLTEDSPISKFLNTNPKGGLHHLCFETKNLEKSIEILSSNQIKIIAPPRIGAHGKPVVFIHPKDTNGILIELC